MCYHTYKTSLMEGVLLCFFCFAFCMNMHIGRILGFTLEVFQEASVVAGISNPWGPGGKVQGTLLYGHGWG